MREHPAYIKFKKYVLTQGLSAAQVEALTVDQISNALQDNGIELSDNFIENMKKLAISKLQANSDESDRSFLAGKLDGIRTRFPDFEVQLQRTEDGRLIKIYLDGRSEA